MRGGESENWIGGGLDDASSRHECITCKLPRDNNVAIHRVNSNRMDLCFPCFVYMHMFWPPLIASCNTTNEYLFVFHFPCCLVAIKTTRDKTG